MRLLPFLLLLLSPRASSAPACPQTPLKDTHALVLMLFNSDAALDARTRVFDGAITTFFRCHPEQLGAPPAKDDSLVKMGAWLKDVQGVPPAEFAAKLSPEARKDLKGFAARLAAFTRRYTLYKGMSAALKEGVSIKRFCLATRDLARASDVPGAERRELVEAYWSYYYPAFSKDKSLSGLDRAAQLDDSCAVVGRGRDGGGELSKRFASLSGFDPAKSGSANFDGTHGRPEASVSVPGLKGPALSTIKTNYRDAGGNYHDGSEIKAGAREDLLSEARRWRELAEGQSEDGAQGFSRFGCESLSLFYLVGARLLADGKPEGPELIRRLERLKSLDAAGWSKVPAKTYYAAVDGVTSIFVHYAESWDDVKNNPTTTQILKFGVSTELFALQVVPAGKGISAVAGAADRKIAQRLAAMAGGDESHWEQVRLAFQVREEQLAASAANQRAGMGLAARNIKRPVTPAGVPAPAAAADAASAEWKKAVDAFAERVGQTLPPAQIDNAARRLAAQYGVEEKILRARLQAAVESAPYPLPAGARELGKGTYGRVYLAEGKALKLEMNVHTEAAMRRLTSLHNDGIAPAMRRLSSELAPQRITVEAPALKPTRVLDGREVRQGFWMPLLEDGPKGWITLDRLLKLRKNDAGNLINAASDYERALHARLPAIKAACDRAHTEAEKAVFKLGVDANKRLDENAANFYVRMSDDGSITIWNMDFLTPGH